MPTKHSGLAMMREASHGQALPNHNRGTHEQKNCSRAFLPFSSQCLRKQCRIKIQWARREAMLQLDSWLASENAYRGRTASLLREGI